MDTRLEVTTKLDAAAYEAALASLHQLIMRMPEHLQKMAFDFMQHVPELITGDTAATTVGATVVITITPSQQLLEFTGAVRRMDFFRICARYGERLPK